MRLAWSLPLLCLAACFDDSVPSSFDAGGGADSGAQDGAAPDAGTRDGGSLVGDGANSDFACGPVACHAGYYCVRIFDDAGAETTDDCYPLLSCADCTCVQAVVSSAYCSGQMVTCLGLTQLVATCRQ